MQNVSNFLNLGKRTNTNESFDSSKITESAQQKNNVSDYLNAFKSSKQLIVEEPPSLYEFKEMKMLLVLKEKTISNLTAMLFDLQSSVTQFRIVFETIPETKIESDSEIHIRIKQFIEEIKKLNDHICLLKDTCELYQKDAEKSYERAKQTELEKERIKENHLKDLENLKNMAKNREKELIKDRETVKIE